MILSKSEILSNVEDFIFNSEWKISSTIYKEDSAECWVTVVNDEYTFTMGDKDYVLGYTFYNTPGACEDCGHVAYASDNSVGLSLPCQPILATPLKSL